MKALDLDCDSTFNISHTPTSSGTIPYDALCISTLFNQLDLADNGCKLTDTTYNGQGKLPYIFQDLWDIPCTPAGGVLLFE